jgi:flagellar protein FliS
MDTNELEKRISTTNDAGLIAMLYERLIDNFNQCKIALDNNDFDKLNKLNNNSRDILAELIVQFSGNDDVSLKIREISLYVTKLMAQAQIKKDASIYDDCINILTPICEGFQQLEVKETPKAITGFTYGKGNLEEYSLSKSKSFEV